MRRSFRYPFFVQKKKKKSDLLQSKFLFQKYFIFKRSTQTLLDIHCLKNLIRLITKKMETEINWMQLIVRERISFNLRLLSKSYYRFSAISLHLKYRIGKIFMGISEILEIQTSAIYAVSFTAHILTRKNSKS